MRQFIIGSVIICMCVVVAACGTSERITDKSETVSGENRMEAEEMYTRKTKISDVVNDEVFGDYGRLIFPAESGYYSGDTLEELKLTWYNNIDPDTTVKIVNKMKSSVMQGETIFYDIYSDEEKRLIQRKKIRGCFSSKEIQVKSLQCVMPEAHLHMWEPCRTASRMH